MPSTCALIVLFALRGLFHRGHFSGLGAFPRLVPVGRWIGDLVLGFPSCLGLDLALNASVIAYNAFHKRMVFFSSNDGGLSILPADGCLQCRERSSMERGRLVAELCPWFVYCGFDLCGQAGVRRRVIAWWPCLFLYFPILMAGFHTNPTIG